MRLRRAVRTPYNESSLGSELFYHARCNNRCVVVARKGTAIGPSQRRGRDGSAHKVTREVSATFIRYPRDDIHTVLGTQRAHTRAHAAAGVRAERRLRRGNIRELLPDGRASPLNWRREERFEPVNATRRRGRQEV